VSTIVDTGGGRESPARTHEKNPLSARRPSGFPGKLEIVSTSGVVEEFFDASFLEELEGLAQAAGTAIPPSPTGADLEQELASFRAPAPGTEAPLDEAGFVELPPAELAARTNALVESCRRSPRREAVEAVENFIVFFQALVPSLSVEGAREIKRAFFRLVPMLLHIAYHDFAGRDDDREEGRTALRNLESILLEIASIHLAPTESELVFRSIDQLAALVNVGQYAMANELVSTRLLSLIQKNKVTRALYRIMEVEVSVQIYLKEKLGYSTPQIRIPDDFDALAEYGPVRVLREASPEGEPKTFLQVHLPNLPSLRDVVLSLVRDDGLIGYELRLDNLGSVEIDLAPATYRIGLVYQP
jgi:hypothetical protein